MDWLSASGLADLAGTTAEEIRAASRPRHPDHLTALVDSGPATYKERAYSRRASAPDFQCTGLQRPSGKDDCPWIFWRRLRTGARPHA